MDIDVTITARHDVESIPSRQGRRTSASRQRWAFWGGALPLIAAGFVIFPRLGVKPTKYVTQEVTHGALTVTVIATGKVEPRNQVEIGSELSGIVREVAVDANDEVKEGQLLATLDTSRLQAQLLQAQGSVVSAKARVLQSAASLRAATADRTRLLRVRELSGNRLPSDRDFDAAEAVVARAEGDVTAARAAVAQARANRDAILTDLSKAEIRSSINGVVLVRSVEPGQTVAASLQAPVLFILAQDLRKMELHVAVDEADIAAVHPGQRATFSVDAFPNLVFEARIARIHLASSNTQTAAGALTGPTNHTTETVTGVVTYEAVLEVENTDLLLRPGMTATTEIVTSSINDATLVPNVALRFTPSDAPLPVPKDSDRGSGMMVLMPYIPDRWQCPREGGQALGCVWVLENDKPALVLFKLGPTDRSMTQVLELERLPSWASLARLRNDKVLTRAVRRRLEPGTPVIVDVAVRTL